MAYSGYFLLYVRLYFSAWGLSQPTFHPGSRRFSPSWAHGRQPLRFNSSSMGLFNFVFPLDGILLLSYRGVWLLLEPVSTGWVEALPLAV
jgi:hypothetical protein